MKEVYGDLWTYHHGLEPHYKPIICITTNGYVKKDGSAVMGRGVAKECLLKHRGIDATLGYLIRTYGNQVQMIIKDYEIPIYAFPVKHHWRELADFDLIQGSAGQLANLAMANPMNIYILPRPGCGNGQRDWLTEVRPIIEPILPDNVHVITKHQYYNRS